MADISKIKLPNDNTIYDIRDKATHVELTQAAYEALEQAGEVIPNKVYFIKDANGTVVAQYVRYSNTTSELSATNVQAAIDEVVENKADRVPEPAEYDPTATYAVGDYCIYNNTYYCCISAISTPEAWTQAHWTGLPTPQQDYLHSIDPAGIGTLSMNRASGSTIGLNSVAIGYNGTASGTDSHAEGGATTASGDESHAEGLTTTASGYASHAEGLTTTASGDGSHAEGRKSKATGNYAHAEGYNNIASKTGAHAEGSGNSASQTYAHAEGSSTTASGSCSHSEGILTTASGSQAHAEGIGSVASGTCAHAEGDNTVANHKSQHVFGEFNIADVSSAAGYERGNYIEIVGNGTSQTSSNARTLDWSGNEVLAGGLKLNGNLNVSPTIKMTQAEYDAIVDFTPYANTHIVITDAPNLNPTASDIEYSSGVSVADELTSLDTGKAKKSWTTLGTLTESGQGVSISGYKELLIYPKIQGATYINSYVIDTAEFSNMSVFHFSVFQDNTHSYLGAIDYSSNSISFRKVLVDGWTYATLLVKAR